MRLNHYIITSALSHLLFLSFLMTIHPKAEVGLPVFDVKLVGSIEVPTPLSKNGTGVQGFKGSRLGESPPRRRIPASPPRRMRRRPEANVATRVTPLPSVEKGKLSSKLSPQRVAKGDQTPDLALTSDLPPKTIHGEGEDTDTKTGSVVREEGKVAPKPKSFLFDKETIERFAKKEPTYEKELNFDTSDLRHRGYLRMLKEKIESIWKYPYEAATSGISGDLYIRFSIKKNGRIGEIELIRTSGHKDLDSSAMKAIKDGEPYWPLPQDWDKDELTITGHFIYILGGFYIM